MHYLFVAHRKGVVTYILSFPGGPSAIAAYLRARWSLGNVQHRYIFEGEGSDQLCGRTAVGLPLHSVDFTILPPHFPSTFVISQHQWEEMYAPYRRLPVGFKQCMPFF
jgi:hypothetical protein